ncbi:DNA polymerase III subunit alpha [Pseudonocardia alni]|uniref:DNA polymerase III subunit alpha n=1 Tax=Pseudonocardia alni TaxID=33907 RepID=UPI003402F66A
MDSFAHLHVHTEYSMLDGAAKVKALADEAARLGMPAIGMTDHGNMYGADDFYRTVTAAGLTPIIGIEAYVAPESRFHRKPVLWGRPGQAGGGDVSGAGAYTHMTMLAADAVGLRNLFRLSSLASIEGFYRKPRMDKELIAQHTSGIIATTGCPSGEVQTRLRLGQRAEARAAAADYRDIFGRENFYLELMDHGLSIERSVRDGLLEIGRDLDLQPLATNDSHYVTADQASSHAALLCVQSGRTLDDPNRFKFGGDGYHLKSAEEMRSFWDAEVPGAADATLAVAQRIEPYADVWAERDRMPVFDVPHGHDAASWLRAQVDQGLQRRLPAGVPDAYRDRATFEIDIIVDKGFPGYFLITADLMAFARDNGIRTGPGRGSAAGSLVAYALGITNLDPLEHGLLFERFLNPERVSMPDIDMDFDDRRRGEMLAYATNKYGSDRIAQVITFGTIKTKAALKDAARVHFGAPGFGLADRITRTLPPSVAATDIPLSGIVDPTHERYAEAAEVRALIESDPDAGRVFDTARGLEGLIRNAGVHACAVIMSSEPLIDTVPLWRRDDGSIITGWDYPSCEAIGLLKMDFLGLRNLTVIGDALDGIRTNRGLEIDLDTLTVDDPDTYALLARGESLGVFQLDGNAMRELLRRMLPTGFADVIAVNALYRPGPMAANSHLHYADRKNGREPVEPIHPDLAEPLADILAETHGLIVYQEQIMHIAQRVAGYSMGRADVLRRAMGKKKKSVLEEEFEGFRAGMRSNGFGDDAVQALWDTVLPFAGYAFNKSHAAGYALLGYWTAYLKAHYPAEFMAALLTSVAADKDKSAIYLAECRRMGIRVLPPDVNESGPRFAAVGDDIRFGLGAVRNVGGGVVESLIATRQQDGKYTSFTDFVERTDAVACTKRAVDSLAKAGAFDSLGHTRAGVVAVHEAAIDAITPLKRKAATGQFDLFSGPSQHIDEGSPLLHLRPGTDEYPRNDLLALEREMLGLYVSGHPLDGAEHIIRRHAPQPIATLLTDRREGETRLAGIVTAVDRRVDKRGRPWAICTIEDLDASVEVLFFADAYAAHGRELTTDTALAVHGRTSLRGDTLSVLADSLIRLELGDGSGPVLELTCLPQLVDEDAAIELRQTLRAHHGDTPVHIRLECVAGPRWLALDDYPVTPSAALMGELKAIQAVTGATL